MVMSRKIFLLTSEIFRDTLEMMSSNMERSIQGKEYRQRKAHLSHATAYRGRARRIFFLNSKPPFFCHGCKKELIWNKKAAFDIHHLNRNHEDNRPENLVAICRGCHKKEHSNKGTRYASKFFIAYGFRPKANSNVYNKARDGGLVSWDSIAHLANAVRLSETTGYLKYPCKTRAVLGYSLNEIGIHMGLTRERVRQLLITNPGRVNRAVSDMDRKRLESLPER